MGVYRLLLHCYPKSFRLEYGGEMSAVFAQQLRDSGGLLARAALWLGTLTEVLAGATAVHVDILRRDLRQGARQLRRTPGFAMTAVLPIALGTGANAAVFSVTDYVLFQSLPFSDPGRLVKVWESRPGYGRLELSPANYRDWRERATSVEAFAALTLTSANLVGEGEPVSVEGALVSAEFFGVLGVDPIAGRTFLPADTEPSAAPTVVLGHALWRGRFGGSSSVIGRVVRLDGTAHEVIGVMPPDFVYPGRDTAYFAPLILNEESYQDRNNNYLQGVARLGPGVTLDSAREEFGRVTSQLEREHPIANENGGATINLMQESLSDRARVMLVALAAAALCVLLIACVNLANIMLARALARRRELVVRAALGAGRERLARQLVTEAMGLAVAGGALGLAVAAAAVPLLARLVPEAMPLTGEPTLGWRVLALAAGLMLVTGVGAGLVPVLGSGRPGMSALREGQREGGGRKERLRGVFVAVSIASSVVLLVATGLLVRTFWTLRTADTGFDSNGVVTLRTALPMPEYQDAEGRVRWFNDVLAEVRALPGVADAAYISFLPMAMGGGIWPVVLDEGDVRREQGRVASLRFVTPGFFDTLRIPLHQGRDVSAADTFDRPFVAVVSEAFAEQHWPGEPALGKRFGFAFFEREIVGIVGDISVRGPELQSEPQVYLPAGQVPDGGLPFYTPKDMVVRSSLGVETLQPALRDVIRRADPDQPVSSVQMLSAVVNAQTATRSVQLRVITVFAGVALLLAAIGIHGVLAFVVSQRTREIGVRMALGADSGDVLAMVVRRTAVLLVAGLVPGLVVAWAAARQLEAALVGVTPRDPITFAAAVALCVAAALVGCIVPARRAVAVDPATAIRTE